MFEIESVDQYLYHYTSREVGLENIVGEMKIRFSPYANTNDPPKNQVHLNSVGAMHLVKN